MSKKENLAQLLIESAKLLNDEYEPLNEGIYLEKGDIVAGFIALSVLLATTISSIKNNKKKKKLTSLNDMYSICLSKSIKNINDAKFIKIKEGTLKFIEKSYIYTVKYFKECDSLLKRYLNLENYSSKNSIKNFIKELKDILHDGKKIYNQYKLNITKLKSELIKDNWIDSNKNDLLSILNKFNNLNSTIPNSHTSFMDIYDFIYDTFYYEKINPNILDTDNPDYDKLMEFEEDIYSIYEFLHIVSNSIKVQFKGKKIKE